VPSADEFSTDSVNKPSYEASTDPAAHTIAGDRGIPSVNRARSLQSRVSNALAMVLMGSLGLGFISWYYVQAFARQSRAKAHAQSSVQQKANAEMVLPALGRVDPPAVAPDVIERVLGPAPEIPEDLSRADADLSLYRQPPVTTAAAGKTPLQLELERRLSGPAFVTSGTSTASVASANAHIAGSELEPSAISGESASSSPDLATSLKPTLTAAVSAGVLPTQRLLLAKGSFVDCTLETALDSSLPGMATCITATDTFSIDGKVILLERGTKLVGETRGSVRQGAARVFVLWTQARTPTGVVVDLASPATDELGRAGLPGEVDRHFLERFGAAMLISVIDGVVQGAAQSSTDGSTVIYNPSASQDIVTEVLKSTVNIPPTVRKQQGDRIQVLVARDLDFRSVYRLQAVGARP
jgi:type IV secretion system protein VirB10